MFRSAFNPAILAQNTIESISNRNYLKKAKTKKIRESVRSSDIVLVHLMASTLTTSTSLIPSMSEILATSSSQGLRIHLSTLGPFFRVKAHRSGDEAAELGKAEGVIRPWVGGKVLHLDSMRMSRATLELDKSIFGLGLFLGAVVIRHGFDQGCNRAELLAINDTPLYHSKLVRFYKRMGFRVVHVVDGSSMEDLAHMLVWGGKGTKMEAQIEDLMVKWGKRFKPQG